MFIQTSKLCLHMLEQNAFKNFKMPRYEQVRWQLQQLLMRSKWTVDRPIPSEQELVSQYGVSIGTIRKAVECLVEDGLLVKIQGKGTFLKYPNFDSSLLRFFRLRDKNGNDVMPTGEVKKMQIMDADPDINQKLGLEADAQLIYIERVRKNAEQVVLSEKIWLSAERFQALSQLELNQFDNLLYPFYYEKCGQFVISATEQLSFLTQHQDAYFSMAKQQPMVRVCRWAKNIEGDVIEYRESYGLAENFNYEISIH